MKKRSDLTSKDWFHSVRLVRAACDITSRVGCLRWTRMTTILEQKNKQNSFNKNTELGKCSPNKFQGYWLSTISNLLSFSSKTVFSNSQTCKITLGSKRDAEFFGMCIPSNNPHSIQKHYTMSAIKIRQLPFTGKINFTLAFADFLHLRCIQVCSRQLNTMVTVSNYSSIFKGLKGDHDICRAGLKGFI